MLISDDQLSRWTSPAFGNEEERADKTEHDIRAAVKKHPLLAELDVLVMPKGSYKNNTNVRRNSDIDIAVIHEGETALDFEVEGMDLHSSGFSPYTGIDKLIFKRAVGEALIKSFGSSVDSSGNLVFRIRGSNTIMDADVIPATRYMYVGPVYRHQGIALIPNTSAPFHHVNYPEQHYQNGVTKNKNTRMRYKSAVRIFKNLALKLAEDKVIKEVPSFLIECLVYNVRDYVFSQSDDWRSTIWNSCLKIYEYVSVPQEPFGNDRWLEVNERKFLFHSGQRWSKVQANEFILHAHRLVAK
jgi:hypothetical protein